MKKSINKIIIIFLSLIILLSILISISFTAAAKNIIVIDQIEDIASLKTNSNFSSNSCFNLTYKKLGLQKEVYSIGRYSNWAGVSNISQFTDNNNNFCFAMQDNNKVVIYKIINDALNKMFSVSIGSNNQEARLGTAVCDTSGNIYIVWGADNESDDTSVNTIFVSKYSQNGTHIATVGGNGSEGLEYYYGERFYTKLPFDGGNCDAAINGNILLVNYAREMYSGHQSNGLFAVNINTMEKITGIKNYNSHSFDQRVTPYSKTNGFILESHGDCFDRNFTTSVTDTKNTIVDTFNSFDFWVEKGAYDDYNMWELNTTYARLGNILETSRGVALIGSSGRSLSEKVYQEPKDVFVQVFDPTKDYSNKDTYITRGERSGYAGMNGDKKVTNYGVNWLTDFKTSDYSADVVQAVSTNDDKIVILYGVEDPSYYSYDMFSYYIVIGPDGSVIKKPTYIGNINLNIDEDPLYINDSVQWISNYPNSDELVLCKLSACSSWNDDNTHYTLTDNGTLSIQGNTEIPCFSGNFHTSNIESYAPWKKESNNIKKILINDGVSSIGTGAFYGCKFLTDVQIPKTVKKIGSLAFCNCDALTSILIPKTVTQIENYSLGYYNNNNNYYYSRIKNFTIYGVNGSEAERYAYENGFIFRNHGWILINGKYYYLDTNGEYLKGWQNINGYDYYLDPKDGYMYEGVQYVESDKSYYYFKLNGSGKKLEKINTVDWYKSPEGDYYYFTGTKENPKLVKDGFYEIRGNIYYLDPVSGIMAEGWKKIGNYYYYFKPGGSGKMLTGWQEINGGRFYFETNKSNNLGHMYLGYQKIDGDYYYFKEENESGRMLTGNIKINGVIHSFDSVTGKEIVNKKGDANKDNIVDILDVTCIQRWLAKLIGNDKINLTVADVNKDNIVDVLDATRIQKWLAHIIDNL